MAVITPCLSANEKKHWWLTNRKIVEKYIREARSLIATQEPSEIASALRLLDAALALQPRLEPALELKARSLLCLRRFKDVADMLQDYIPSLKIAADDSDSDHSSSQGLSRDRVKLLHSSSDSEAHEYPSFKCFSVSDLKKKLLASLCKNLDKEGQWRYLVLGQACCHLGLMEDAMALLQTGKRLATAAFRRESICWSDDSFSLHDLTETASVTTAGSSPPRASEFETISQLLSHIKLLIRRRTAALAALDAGLYAEAIRHFSKILDGRRAAPQRFLAECYVHRAAAFRSSGRIAESIADCNRTLALDPSSIHALETRASLFEKIRCLTDSLHDLEHLKLLYNSILRDRKLPGPAWKRHNVRYREIPGKLCVLTAKINELKKRVAGGETGNVDYYALIGLRRGCSRSELERAYLLLCLKHKPDKATAFIERCEISDDFNDQDSIRDRAKMSALLLYRLIQKAHTSVTSAIVDEEITEKRKQIAAAIQAQSPEPETPASQIGNVKSSPSNFQGVFCRDLATVGTILSQVGFNRPIPMKYEALTC